MDYGDKKSFFKQFTKTKRNGLLFAWRAAGAWRSNGFIDMFVVGGKGAGKTAYSLYCLYSCYGNWKDALDHLIFEPDVLMRLFDKVNDLAVKVPMVVIDDAATHLAKSTWYETDTLNFSKMYNVIRSVAGSAIMNAPSEKVPSSISNDIRYIAKVRYIPEKTVKAIIKDKSDPLWKWYTRLVWRAKEIGVPNPYRFSTATIYHKIMYPSGKVIIASEHDYDTFPQHYPKEVYEPYEELRRATVKKLIQQCLHPELSEKKGPGRPIDNIEISKTIYHTAKSLGERGVSRNKMWKEMGLPNRTKLLYHIDKYESYLKDSQVTKGN